MTPEIRKVGDSKDGLGESPYWDAREQMLCWIDSMAGLLRRLRPASGECESHALPAPIGSAAPCADGAAVLALRNSFARYDFESRSLEVLASIGIEHPELRLNDGKCDPFGNFVAGTMHRGRASGEAALGGLYRLRPDLSLERIADDFGLTNGPCFSPDGRTLYVAADSTSKIIWACDYAPEGPLGPPRVFANTSCFGSGPDGATVDAEGFLWTVLVRIGQLARFAPDGRLDRLVELPATYPTSLCFGGPGLATAYVTSISRSAHLVGERPQDGGLFEVSGLPAPGLEPHRFGAA